MNLKAATLCLILSFGCLSAESESVERIKRMISLNQPLEGTFTVSNSGTNQIYEIGIQPGTWYVRNPQGPRDSAMSSGQSYSMTWAFGGNSVHVLPIKDTRPLIPMGSVTGVGPEGRCQGDLGMLHFVTRFGVHSAETNGLKWDGLEFHGQGSASMTASGPVSGQIEVSQGIPMRVVTNWKNDYGTHKRVFNFVSHDTNGFPIAIEISNDGKRSPKTIRISDLRFGSREFKDSDGYTPSLLHEGGREFTFFYSNRVAQVIGPDGEIQVQPKAPPAIAEGSAVFESRSFWFVVVGLAAVITAAIWFKKR
jgi:hypothetical protein